MKYRDRAIEAVAAVLRSSAAADSSLHDSDMRGFATDIVSVVEAVDDGASIRKAVTAHWNMDEYERSREFGENDVALGCPHGDQLCPCPDGDPCHYTGPSPAICPTPGHCS